MSEKLFRALLILALFCIVLSLFGLLTALLQIRDAFCMRWGCTW